MVRADRPAGISDPLSDGEEGEEEEEDRQRKESMWKLGGQDQQKN